MLRGGRRACRNGRRAAAGQVGRSGHHAGEARRFLRDVRGDTVHPSTLVLLNELGLGARFPALRQRRVSTVKLPAGLAARCSPSAICACCPRRITTSRWSRSGTCSTCWRTRPGASDLQPAHEHRGDRVPAKSRPSDGECTTAPPPTRSVSYGRP
jgi:hypothetical protein